MQLSRISQGEGKLGPMGVERNVSSSWLREVFDACVVAKDVFMVLPCLSIKPLDLGYKGDEVIWSMACDVKNCEKGCDEKGGPLSEKKHWGLPNCEKRSCKWLIILSVVLEWTL